MTFDMKASARRGARLGVYVARRFVADRALDMASSLAYTSLLSLVPLVAIALAMLAAFPAFDGVRDQLLGMGLRIVAPSVGARLDSYLGDFVANAGKLTAAGVVGLAVSAIMLLVTIETSLNRIFRVATPRSPMSRLLVYWTALTLGPLLAGASFSMSGWLFAASHLAGRSAVAALTPVTLTIAPTVLLALTFSLLFVMVPNRRVRPLDGLIGGVAASLAFAVLRWGFGYYVANAPVYESIYGAVALLPIFLFWTYLSWVTVLFGAELSAALPEWRAKHQDLGGPPTARRRLALALTILSLLRDETRRGGHGRRRVELLDAVAEPEHAVLAIMEGLCDQGYAVLGQTGRYVLARDLSTATLGDLVQALGLGLGIVEADDGDEPWMRRIADRLAEAAKAEASALDLPLMTVLEG